MKKIRFYTLLYVDKRFRSLSKNGVRGNFESQIEIHVKCCEALKKSLACFTSYDLVVLTNDKSFLEGYSSELKIVEICFSLNVPKEIDFYSAHFKFDVFKYFLSKEDGIDYNILIDNDVLCIGDVPLNLINCVEKNVPTFYDVTNMRFPAYNRERLIADKEFFLGNEKSIGIWAGGEFIGGDKKFFKQLHGWVERDIDLYFNNYRHFHHQGDEVLLSVAIERMLRSGIYVADVNSFRGISRFWSLPTLHFQNSWKSFRDNFLIHLPADKFYIATLENIDFNLRKRLGAYFFWKLLIGRLKSLVRTRGKK